MEHDIDLRAYVRLFLRHWLWIVGLAVLAAGAALIVSLQTPDRYQATSIVLVTEPRYQIDFDPRLETQWATPAYKAFPTLAASDSILQSVVDAYQPSPQAMGGREWNLETLQDMAVASSGGDPSLVVLTITSRSATDAAALANAWAQVLVREGNEIYSGSEREVAFFEAQLQQAWTSLRTADAAMIEFEARNETDILQAKQDSLHEAQADYLAQQRNIDYIIRDVQGLRQQLAEQSSSRPISLADSLTVLFLQMQAYNLNDTAGPALQLQIDSGSALSDKSLSEQLTFLDNLIAILESRSARIDDRLAELDPEILELQKEIQETQVESSQLNRTRELARETYETLARKVDELQITAQEENSILQIGSQAAAPRKPIGPRKLLIVAVAGVLGLVIGGFGVFVVDFWRRDSPPSG
jgi:uncharacterized protein involved in exopolysaccharide biosynthesis